MHIFAHRGASGTHPENTLAAFQKAASLPIYGVEFDVHMTKDNELVVIHDETIDRTSTGSGFVKDLTLTQLKQYDFGSWKDVRFQHERIPTLREVLTLLAPSHLQLNIELKSDIFPYTGMVEKVLSLITELQIEERVILSSFDHDAVRLAKKLAPHMEVAALCMEVLVDPLAYLEKVPADALHIFFPAALRPSIHEVLASSKPVRTFTVNEEMYAAMLRQAGVDAIFTDYPEQLFSFLQAHQ